MGGDDEHFFDKKLSDFRVFDKWLPSKMHLVASDKGIELFGAVRGSSFDLSI
jgi:hypothetical protein